MPQRDKFKNILILHPGAIGDVMLATPVAAVLKDNFPESKLSYWTHASLIDLLKLTKTVDEIFVYNKRDSWLTQRRWLSKFGADLIVDLSGSLRSYLITSCLGVSVVHYRKQESNRNMHAVENFLDTLHPLSLDMRNACHPTIFPSLMDIQYVSSRIKQNIGGQQKIVGLVAGVGSLRCHRAWDPNGYIELGKQLIAKNLLPVLIGGKDDQQLCDSISSKTDIISFASQLSLPQTAALLSLCSVVVSGDTGPAHLAVAVGTKVIGLYGPTFPNRSGPYGCNDLLIDRSGSCSCHKYKTCQISIGVSACMQQISVDDVMAKLGLPTLQ